MRSDADRAADILRAIERIERRIGADYEQFLRDEMLQTWVVHHLEIIGEAIKGLSEGFRAARPDVPWSEAARMPDRLIHACWDIDVRAVWQTARRDLPPMGDAIRRPA